MTLLITKTHLVTHAQILILTPFQKVDKLGTGNINNIILRNKGGLSEAINLAVYGRYIHAQFPTSLSENLREDWHISGKQYTCVVVWNLTNTNYTQEVSTTYILYGRID